MAHCDRPPTVIAANKQELSRKGYASLQAWIDADPQHHIYIGRYMRVPGASQSVWANNYHVKDFGLAKALQLYEAKVRTWPDLKERLKALGGCTLACWCRKHNSPVDPEICHGDILVRLYREAWLSQTPDA